MDSDPHSLISKTTQPDPCQNPREEISTQQGNESEVIARATVGGDDGFDTSLPNFRESPMLVLNDEAQNAVEALLLTQMGLFHRQMLDALDTAGRTYDRNYKDHFISTAMTYSNHCAKLWDCILKGRRTGRQEVIVKHQTVSAPATRRASRTTAPAPASAARVSPNEAQRA